MIEMSNQKSQRKSKPSLFGDVPGLIFDFIAKAFKTVFSRIFRGPLRESWSWKLELIIRLTRVSYDFLAKKGPERYTSAFERIMPKIEGNGATIEISEEKNAPGHWFIPDNPNSVVILYFHGGGYVYGSAKTHGRMIGVQHPPELLLLTIV